MGSPRAQPTQEDTSPTGRAASAARGAQDSTAFEQDLPEAILHPVELVFASRPLEHAYRLAMHASTLASLRFGMFLAMALYLAFGALDPLLAPEASTRFLWTVRGVVLAFTLVILAASWSMAFIRWRERAVSLLVLMLGSGLTTLIAVLPDRVVDQYYVGYLLLFFATFSIFGLRFINGLLTSAIMIAMYLGTELLLRDGITLRVATNLMFLLATLAISAIAGYTAERQRRLAYSRQVFIEHAQLRSEHFALHDPLTGLPNRRLLLEKLQQALARDERYGTCTAVLFIDLDAFKPINDQHGHSFGDALLCAVGQRLRNHVRATDTIARIGGDEFVALIEDLEDVEDAVPVAEEIAAAFKAPVVVRDVAIAVEMSVGIAVHPRDGNDAMTLLDAADRAMYGTKHAHGRRQASE